MIIAKKRSNNEFLYLDTGFLRGGIFSFVRLLKCSVCNISHGRGFESKKKEMFTNKDINQFICINCAFHYLNENGITLIDERQLGFFETNIIRKYSDLRKRYKEGKITESNFKEHLNQFSKFIYSIIIEHIDCLVDLDIEYIHSSKYKTQWHGWWLGASGNDVSHYLNYLKNVISNKIIKDQKSISSNLIRSLPSEFNRLLRVSNKFMK